MKKYSKVFLILLLAGIFATHTSPAYADWKVAGTLDSSVGSLDVNKCNYRFRLSTQNYALSQWVNVSFINEIRNSNNALNGYEFRSNISPLDLFNFYDKLVYADFAVFSELDGDPTIIPRSLQFHVTISPSGSVMNAYIHHKYKIVGSTNLYGVNRTFQVSRRDLITLEKECNSSSLLTNK